MNPSHPDAARPLGERRARVGETQGYLSLGLTTLLLVIALIPTPRTFEPYKTAIGLAVLAVVLILVPRGIRLGRGGGRIAAWMSLGVLSLWLLATLVIGCIEVGDMVAEGRP